MKDLVTEMSRSEICEIESGVIIEHVLKIRYVKGQVGLDHVRGWKKTARDQRNELADHIEENPGLKPKLTGAFVDRVYRSNWWSEHGLPGDSVFPDKAIAAGRHHWNRSNGGIAEVIERFPALPGLFAECPGLAALLILSACLDLLCDVLKFCFVDCQQASQ